MKITKKELQKLVEEAIHESGDFPGKHPGVPYDKEDLHKKYSAKQEKILSRVDRPAPTAVDALRYILKRAIEEAYDIGSEDGYNDGLQDGKDISEFGETSAEQEKRQGR